MVDLTQIEGTLCKTTTREGRGCPSEDQSSNLSKGGDCEAPDEEAKTQLGRFRSRTSSKKERKKERNGKGLTWSQRMKRMRERRRRKEKKRRERG